jgi:hypothetical protein
MGSARSEEDELSKDARMFVDYLIALTLRVKLFCFRSFDFLQFRNRIHS